MAWNHKCKASILTFDITGFFDTIPHSHLLDMLCSQHLPLPIVQWVHTFLQDRWMTICLDGKRDELCPIHTGVPQGLCVSPILAAYFTSPMIGEVHLRTKKCIEESPELSSLAKEENIMLSPITLYVDDGVILMSSPDLIATTQINTMGFEETHKWLSHRGLQMDQVKNKLMHFTKSKKQNNNPSIHILLNNPAK